MKEAHLRDFIAVFDHGGVRAAARQLGLTQAAVSRNLQALERSCGHTLMVRANHGIELTAAGRILLQRVRAAQTELTRAQQEMDILLGGSGAEVALGLAPAVETLLMPQAVMKFRKSFPDTVINITTGPTAHTITALREGRVEFLVGSAVEPALASGLTAERLMSIDLVVVARKGHPLSRSRELARLADCGWVVGTSKEQDQGLLAALQASGLPPPRIVARRDSTSTLLQLLMHSDALGIASLAASQLYCDVGLLQVLNVSLKLPSVVQYITTLANRPLTAPAAALANEFRRLARKYRK